MTATIFYAADADPGLITSRRVAVIGYGSQGHAHARNLVDSGVDVVVGLREGSGSWDAAVEAGMEVATPAEAAASADLVMILIPDPDQPTVFAQIKDHLRPGDALLFAHGFNIHYGYIKPPEGVDVAMVAPKGPGHLVRRTFEQGSGVPALVAVAQDATGKALPLALSYAHGIGATRAGVLETTFREETETDLFGEQVILCGGISELIKASFETLVEGGYAPESAYFEVLHELKLIVDLLFEGGLSWMRHSISDTAEYGDYTRGNRIVTEDTRNAMRAILGEIQSGEFAEEWMTEHAEGAAFLLEQREKERAHPIEEVGTELRRMMPFLDEKQAPA